MSEYLLNKQCLNKSCSNYANRVPKYEDRYCRLCGIKLDGTEECVCGEYFPEKGVIYCPMCGVHLATELKPKTK